MILLCKCYTNRPWRVGLNINVMYLLVLNHSGMCGMTFMLQIEFYSGIIIPPAWRKDILQKLHISHSGIEKSKANARMTVF